MAVLYLEADLLAIRAARMRGIRQVTFADRQVTYTSDAEMRQVEQDILAGLAAASPVRLRSRQSHLVASKGFNPSSSNGWVW